MKQQKKNLVIGNQSAYSAADWSVPFEYAVANEFNAFEWFPDKKDDGGGWRSEDIPPLERAKIKQRAQQANMRLSLHAPWWADIFTAEGRDIVLQELDFAEEIGATLLNIHLYTEHGIDAYIAALKPLAVKAAKNNIIIAIENTPLTSPTDFNQLFQRWRSSEESDTCSVCMCLDSGHANLYAETRNDYIGYLNALDRDLPIGHVHLHENYGDRDSHLTIFTGPAADNDEGVRLLLEKLQQRGFSGAIILEQWPQPPELLLEARRHLEEISSSLSAKPLPVTPVQSKPVAKKKKDPIASEATAAAVSDTAKAKRQKKKFLESAPVLSDSARQLAQISVDNLSWRRRLKALLDDFLLDSDIAAADRLGYSAVYLQLIANGQLVCEEDSGHHRPNHAANLAREILSQVSALAEAEEHWLLRRILVCLPSFDSAFTHAEPLTRIRDIAHRNDIPSQLKNEIKGRLQNKLHRSAGPEDLVTARELQDRFRADPGHYPAEFRHQFELFMGELEDFFNASQVSRQLAGLPEGPWLESAQAVSPWLEQLPLEKLAQAKWVLDGLQKLYQLRLFLVNDDKPMTDPLGQKLHLLDIGLESTIFALLSQALNQTLSSDLGTTRNPQQKAIRSPAEFDQQRWVSILVMALRHLALAGVSSERISALLAECEGLAAVKRVDPLQIYSWVRRVLYLSEELSQARYQRLQPIIDALAPALDLDDYVRETFAEGDIRANLLFQIAKIATALSETMRAQLGLPPWEVIVPGSVCGVLEYCDELPLTLAGHHRIVLLPGLSGDEAIPSNIGALVIHAELPHLSHVAIRARQQGVVIVCLNRPEDHAQWRRLQGTHVRLTADDSHLELIPWQPQPIHQNETKASAAKVNGGRPSGGKGRGPMQLIGRPYSPVKLYGVAEFELEEVGPKALSSRKLYELAQQNRGFAAPDSWGIPFSALVEQISQADCKGKVEQLLTKLQATGSLANSIAVLEELRTLYRGLNPLHSHPDLLASLPRTHRYAVRSSSNCEDLEGLSGAGWHSSELAVAWEDIPMAIASVWSSLWNEAAVAGRFQAGIAQAEARMAVLLQPMLAAEYCFIIQTVNTVSEDADQVYIELAEGLGEILTSARFRGEPYRLIYAKRQQQARIKNYATYLHALHPGDRGVLDATPINYQLSPLWSQPQQLIELAARLGQIGVSIEAAMGSPQDIEGCVLAGQIHIVQTRPQNVEQIIP
jgi:phosphoglucan,water dikinase